MGTRKYPFSIKSDALRLIKENILNTWDLFKYAENSNTDLFIMISSIAAANPMNIVQTTLRLTEYYLQSIAMCSKIRIANVCLFNLIESPGSILCEIQNQLKSGNKITLNHPEEERCYSTVSTAAKLILQSARMALKCQEPGYCGTYITMLNGNRIKIHDIARYISQNCGVDPDQDLEIDYIRSNDNETWKDDIRIFGQQVGDTDHENVKRIEPSFLLPLIQVEDDIAQFRELVKRNDGDGAVELVNARIEQIAQNQENCVFAQSPQN
jgi:FlaA1/EpsC-like NDP-sugar epimerase